MRDAPKAASAWRSNVFKVSPGLNVQRLQTRPQFQTVLASKLGVRTAHFALHSCELANMTEAPHAASLVCKQPFGDQKSVLHSMLGAMVPKRWAKRAVTRNAIKRQIYSVSQQFVDLLAPRAHVVRLRATFDRNVFVSATSDALKATVRAELLELFTRASVHPQLRA